MALQTAMISSKTNEWATPNWLFNTLNEEFSFTLDPCATDENHKVHKYYTLEDDGLKQDWRGEVVFMNPPYGGKTGQWVKKAYLESLRDAIVVCLLVSSTDRSYWHDYIFPHAAQIRWLRGRIRFGKAVSTAPFANAIIIFDRLGTYTKKRIYQTKLWYIEQLFN